MNDYHCFVALLLVDLPKGLWDFLLMLEAAGVKSSCSDGI